MREPVTTTSETDDWSAAAVGAGACAAAVPHIAVATAAEINQCETFARGKRGVFATVSMVMGSPLACPRLAASGAPEAGMCWIVLASNKV
jgi:hypothetical protein